MNTMSSEVTGFTEEPGAKPAERVKWSHQLTPAEAAPFMPGVFLRGSDGWNPAGE